MQGTEEQHQVWKVKRVNGVSKVGHRGTHNGDSETQEIISKTSTIEARE